MTATTVLGDGTTAAGRAHSRWRRWRWVLMVAVVALLAALASVLPEPRTSQVSLAPDNPAGNGARAVAEVLTDQGVQVQYVRTTAEAVAAARTGTTLLVTSDLLLTDEQVAAVAATPADLVLLDSPDLIGAVTDDLAPGWTSSSTPVAVDAECGDPDAVAAGTLSAGGSGVTGTGEAVLCFPATTEALGTTYLYGVAEADGRRVTVIGDPALFTNDRIADEGNAALSLRALGRHETLVWFVPSADDTTVTAGEDAGLSLTDLLPPRVRMLALLAVVTVVMLALWRGRRLGPVVAEQLPVVVHAAETTRGRARLYRRGSAYGHAAAALRAGAADRCAHRLGLPRSASAEQLDRAVAGATGRPLETITAVFHGPPPTDDAGLQALTRKLDEIESEVHHP